MIFAKMSMLGCWSNHPSPRMALQGHWCGCKVFILFFAENVFLFTWISTFKAKVSYIIRKIVFLKARLQSALVFLWKYLRGVDSALLERTAAWVVRAQVAVFTPVTAKSAVYTGQTPAGQNEHIMTDCSLSVPCNTTAFTQIVNPAHHLHVPFLRLRKGLQTGD